MRIEGGQNTISTNMVTNQLMRRDGRETSKVIINNDVISSSKGCGRIIPDTFANLTLANLACPRVVVGSTSQVKV